MSRITIEPASADRWDDVVHALTGGGDGKSCWCQWWLLTNAEFSATSSTDRRDLLQAQIAAGPPRALVAYVDEEPAGWVRVGPRTHQARLARSVNVKKGTQEPFDDPDVWAVTCLVVRREHRGAGLTHELVRAAVDFARDAGARLVEAYPIDTSVKESSASALFHGTMSVFEGAGFEVVSRPKPERPVMARTL